MPATKKPNKSSSSAASSSAAAASSDAASAAPAGPAVARLRDAPAGSPNIIFINVDQLRADAISALGNPWVHTPNIDSIVRAGTAFLRAQCTHPLSSPSRASWLTGRMPSEHACISNSTDGIPPTIPDYGQWLSARGYDCFHAGKWHVQGRKPQEGFTVLAMGAGYGMGEHTDDACASAAEKFLATRAASGSDRPFLLNVGFINPHDCCYTATPWPNPVFKYGLENNLPDPELPPLHAGYDPAQMVTAGAPEQWNARSMRLNNYTYYRQCEMVDECVGRVFRALRGSRFRDNTVFIFSSDHGEMLGEHNWLGKNILFESAIRIPLVFVAPGRVAENARNDTTVTMGIDVTATILDYAGAEPMPRMTIARSLRPVLEGKAASIHDYVPAEVNSQGCARVSFRQGPHKSIVKLTAGEWQIYNTETDPHEQHNLAKTDPALLATHRKLLADYQSRVVYSDRYREYLANPKSLFANKKSGGDDE